MALLPQQGSRALLLLGCLQVHNEIESYWAADSSDMSIGTMDEVSVLLERAGVEKKFTMAFIVQG